MEKVDRFRVHVPPAKKRPALKYAHQYIAVWHIGWSLRRRLTVKDIFHSGSETRAIGQVGGGMEIRLTPHIGWVSDFGWNFVDGPKNNFGMARTGVNFAF